MSEQSRPILVTGAGSGIGREIAQVLAAAGHAVGVTDLSGETAAETANEITARGGRAVSIGMDVTDTESIRNAVEAVTVQLGGLGGLVNNAGYSYQAPLLDHDDALIERTLAINIAGPIKVSRAVLSELRAYGSGRVVNIASDSARSGLSNAAAYTASKGGVLALSRSLARELARDCITVNTVSPGVVETPMYQQAMEGTEAARKIIASIPLRRLAQPADVASAVAYFCSEAAAYVTGQTISVNGGLVTI